MSIPSSGSSTARSASITSSRVGIAAIVVTRPRDSAGHEPPDGSRVVLADSRQSRELPFLQTMLCLWGAGWVTSAFTSLLFVGRLYPTGGSPALMVAVNILLSAAVGAVVVRWLLRDVVGRELSYSAILLALVAGSAVGSFASLAPRNESQSLLSANTL